MPALSDPGSAVFPGRIAALRGEAARLLRARPVPAQARLEVLRLLQKPLERCRWWCAACWRCAA